MLFFEEKRSYLQVVSFVVSVFIHLVVILCIIYFTEPAIDMGEPTSIKITLNPPEQIPEVKREIPKTKPKILTTDREKTSFNAPVSPPAPVIVPNPPRSMERFLPRSNPEYLQKLRNEATHPKEITGDAGDIPIRGAERRRDMPLILDRFEHKDLSLSQFSQMFHDRFGSVWNSQKRWVPPESPLRPGDVVYYRIFINPDGTLDHVENLTNKMRPTLNTEHLDKIFTSVISQTLPLQLPAKLEKDTQITEVVAIQVTDGNFHMNF